MVGGQALHAFAEVLKLAVRNDTYMHQWALKGLYLLIRKIENIQVHVKKGCLSGIQPGRGTNRNENLHQDLNKNYVAFKVWS